MFETLVIGTNFLIGFDLSDRGNCDDHCHSQKQLFGKEAVQKLNYVECYFDGLNARPDLCEAAKLADVPTWEIKRKLYPGTKILEALANLSGYKGLRIFINTSVSG